METKLQVIEQKTVLFYDDELVAVQDMGGKIYVSFRHLCEALGLDRRGQVRRVNRQRVLARGYRTGDVTSPVGRRQAGLLSVNLVPLWLAGIDTSRVKEELRNKIERYQEEVADVLWEAFQDGRLTIDPTFSELLKNDNNPSVQAYKIAQAVMRMAQQQLILESRVSDNTERIEQLESIVGDSKHHITPAQAVQISQAVKAVAIELGKQSGRNEFGGVYGELYRRFEITSYKQLPKNRFDGAMKFLTDWYAQLTDDDLPF